MTTKNELKVSVPLSSPSAQPWSSPSASLTLTNPHALTPINYLPENYHGKKERDNADGLLNNEGNTEFFNRKIEKKGGMSRFFPKLKIKKSQQYAPYCNSSSREENVQQQQKQHQQQEIKDGFHRLKNASSLSSSKSNTTDKENDNNSMMHKTKIKLKSMTKAIKPNNNKNKKNSKSPIKKDMPNNVDERVGNGHSESEHYVKNPPQKTCNALRISDIKPSNSAISFDRGKGVPTKRTRHRIASSQGTFSTYTTASTATLNSTFSEPEEKKPGHGPKIAGPGSLEFQANSTLTYEDNDVGASSTMDGSFDFFHSFCGQTGQEVEVVPSADSQQTLDTAGTWTSDDFASTSNTAMKTFHLAKKVTTPPGQAANVFPAKESIENANNSNKCNNNDNKMVERQLKTQTLVLTRSALSRPFGRTGLPAHLAKQWQVEVSPLDFDKKNWMWRYRVLVQKEEHGGLSIINGKDDGNIVSAADISSSGGGIKVAGGENGDKSSPSPHAPLQQLLDAQGISLSSSVAAANVTRTLEDFVWLEQTMREEYHGALVLPLLSLVTTNGGSSLDWTTSESMNKDDFRRGEWDPLDMSEKYLDSYLKHGRTERMRMNGVVEENCEIERDKEVDDGVEEGASAARKEGKFPAQVNSKALGDWLSDVINCVRGKGELIIKYGEIDVIHSEAMEMFLYSSKPLPKPATSYYENIAIDNSHSPPTAAKLCAFPQFLSNQFSCANPADICEIMSTDQDAPPPAELYTTLKSDRILSQRSEVYAKLLPRQEWTNLILRRQPHSIASSRSPSLRQKQRQQQQQQQSEAFVLQRLAIANQRECTLRAMYRLRILLDQETLVSGAWKRFAISLSNLYSYEKDIESCKIGDLAMGKKLSSSSSQRKADKGMVDDALRIVARQKMDRAVPSLKVLSVMLSAYFADFSSVDSSLCAYGDALRKVKVSELEVGIGDSNNDNKVDAGWQSHYLSSLSSFLSPSKNCTMDGGGGGGITEVVGQCNDSNEGDNRLSLSIEENMFRRRFLSLESVMESSLLQLCNSTDIRVSRMAWKFFKMESGQATLLRGEAAKLQTKLESINNSNGNKNNKGKDDIPKNDTEKSAEDGKELDLVRKMLDLGIQSKRSNDDITEVECNTSDDREVGDFSQTAAAEALVDNAIEIVSKRPGRWNEDLALVIMEAAGVEDAEALLEETTRDLRQAQKLAVGLRQNVNRCAEAIEMLKEVVIGSDCQGGETMATAPITKLRENFMDELSVVFSGVYDRMDSGTNETNKLYWEGALSKVGINNNDAAGWLYTKNANKGNGVDAQIGHCGEAAIQYQRIREEETPQLLDNLSGILDDYEHRIQNIENFVYMHCVGIQLEKHFSKQRVEALAAWDRKTDINTAINIATRKRLPLIVQELKTKMSDIKYVSHTSVKEAKERHLSSKVLKGELEALSFRRFQQLKEDATTQVVELIKLWAYHEESLADIEVKKLTDTIQEIERHVSTHENIIKADGGAHLFALCGVLSNNGHAPSTSKPPTINTIPPTANGEIKQCQKKLSKKIKSKVKKARAM